MMTPGEKEFFDEVRLAAVDDEMIRAIQIIDRVITENNRLSARVEESEKQLIGADMRIGNLMMKVEELERENTNLKACNQAYVNEEEFNGRVVDELLLTKAQLSTALSEKSAYREALEKVCTVLDEEFSDHAADIQQGGEPGTGGVNPVYSEVYSIARAALDRGPEALTEEEKFTEHLERASKKVAEWPEWKRNLLGKIPGKEEPVGREVTREELAKIVREKADEWCSLEVENEVQEHIAAHLLATFLVERR